MHERTNLRHFRRLTKFDQKLQSRIKPSTFNRDLIMNSVTTKNSSQGSRVQE